ncbi:hypothetical protein HAX54_003993 [Datura stramonium]|uniref:Hexosyltransferase n=1 Tax=Datura stramonium TaxID=4076 RepID=A0ABS8WX38_DATST|nr:hypothetical protein [Datura stramonium]
MQYEAVRSGEVAVHFIGLDKNRQVNFELWKEAQVYGDIQLLPFVDYYSLLTLKTIAICIMGVKILPAKYHPTGIKKQIGISVEEYPPSSYPHGHMDSYISRDIAKFIVQGHQEKELMLFKLEDVALGIWVENSGGRVTKYSMLMMKKFYNAGCESIYILACTLSESEDGTMSVGETAERASEPNCCE